MTEGVSQRIQMNEIMRCKQTDMQMQRKIGRQIYGKKRKEETDKIGDLMDSQRGGLKYTVELTKRASK